MILLRKLRCKAHYSICQQKVIIRRGSGKSYFRIYRLDAQERESREGLGRVVVILFLNIIGTVSRDWIGTF
jgi:hypothetical protein